MNVKAIIHEVFVELTSSSARPGMQETPDKFLPVRRRYLDSFLDEYNGRKAPMVDEGHQAGKSSAAWFKALPSEAATK